MPFADLGLSEAVLNAVTDAGYSEPTPIQAQAIPYVLQGRDVLGVAQTGTGKTASFTLPLIDVLDGARTRARMPGALILEPTRELADQVAASFETYGKYTKLSMALIIGGVSFADQEKKLDRGVNVLIATPGRLLDQFERGKVMLNDVKVLVIDEADRMLDMGFMPDVEKIVSLLPPMRQTLFFSATMSPEMRRLADAFLSNPREVRVAPAASPAATVVQAIVRVRQNDKREALRHLIRQENVKNAIVFCNRKRDVQILHKSLDRHGFSCGALHGDMSQPARTEMLQKFKAGEIAIMVASDVAARGLDVQGLSHVFNFDVPIHSEDYVHRIGRTGRAGLTGHAFTLVTSEDAKHLAAIVKLIGKDVPEVKIPALDLDEERPDFNEPRPKRARGERPDREERPAREERRPRRDREERRPRNEPPIRSGEQPVRSGEPPIRSGEQPVRADRAPEPVRDARPDRKGDRRDRRRGRDDLEDDIPIIGFGDHVPDFVHRRAIRPTAAATTAEAEA